MRTIDVGVRDVVTLLNAIPGVTTRTSCEGTGTTRSPHRHADLAYVLLQYPMPLALQDFLLTRVDAIARIERDGVYSRWPEDNREFLLQLADAARAYHTHDDVAGEHLRVPLARLRAVVARRLTQREAAQIGLCPTCSQLIVDRHTESHVMLPLLHIPHDQALQWFAAFVSRSANRLDPRLLEREGLEHVMARAQRGDFGVAFHRRWLAHRSGCLANLTTHQLRFGVEAARRHGCRIDFYFDGMHAHFAWDPYVSLRSLG